MTINEVLQLVNAGYTKEEIAAMEMPAEEAKPVETVTVDDPETVSVPEEKPEPKPEKQPESIDDIFMAELNKTLAAMNETLKDIQNANIRHSKGQQPESPVDIASNILAEVIAPQKGKKK